MRRPVLLLCLLLLACGGENSGKGNSKAGAADPAAIGVPSVRALTLPELQQLIRDRQGKQLVLNMWATWCVPCKEEFPDLVKLAENTSNSVDIVGVSLDYPEEIESRIMPFLRQNPVNFPIYVAEVASQDDFINSLNRDWSGALPTTFIYDSDGRQITMMMGKRKLVDFEAALLQTSPAGTAE